LPYGGQTAQPDQSGCQKFVPLLVKGLGMVGGLMRVRHSEPTRSQEFTLPPAEFRKVSDLVQETWIRRERRAPMKGNRLFLIVLTAAALGLVGCAKHGRFHEQSLPDPASYNAHFGDMDTDGDDMVSWEEFKTYFPSAERNVYDALDLNQDGGVDHDEWHAFKEAHGLKHIE
jgi:hypothetical protein